MGRNSVEATKASLMRAVRARLAALTAGLTGFLDFMAVVGVVFPGLLAVGVGFVAVCVVFCAVLCAVGFFAAEVACPAGLAVEPPLAEPPEDCPVTGSTIIKKESRPARQQEASREMEVGEDTNLISSLYLLLVACVAHQRQPRTMAVTAIVAK
jgi:hypothetical protein